MAGSKQRRCVRCQCDVEVVYEHSAAARRWWRAYFIVPILILPALPMLASDYAVSLPLIMAYMIGYGQVLSIVRDPPLCATCGALIPAAVRR